MFAIPANVSPEKLERVIALFNFLASAEGRMLTKYGIEGVNYEVIEGKPQRLSATSFNDIGHVWLYQLLGRAPESEYLSVRFPNQREYIDFVDSQPRIYSLEGYVPAMDGYVLADAEKYAAEEFVKFINGSRDLSDYKNFLETLKTTFGYGMYMDYAEGVLQKLNVL
jgi:putative aldouronate transport system substrate-binding protein